MDSIDKFKEIKLPSIDRFYSKLQKKHITDNDYAHAKKLWDVFGMKTLGDYHNPYVQADTAQLSDVYLDVNNLYEYAMCKKLPLNGYKWEDTSLFTEEFIKNYDEEGDTGYLLEVDVEYPKELASKHRGFTIFA